MIKKLPKSFQDLDIWLPADGLLCYDPKGSGFHSGLLPSEILKIMELLGSGEVQEARPGEEVSHLALTPSCNPFYLGFSIAVM